MPRKEVYHNSTICYKFALKVGFEMPCLRDIARRNCINDPFNRILTKPITLSITTFRDEDGAPGFNFYTKFYASFKFVKCIDRKLYHRGKDNFELRSLILIHLPSPLSPEIRLRPETERSHMIVMSYARADLSLS